MAFFSKKNFKKDPMELLTKLNSDGRYELSLEEVKYFSNNDFLNNFIDLYKEKMRDENLDVTVYIKVMNYLLLYNTNAFIKFLERTIEIPKILDKYDDSFFRLRAMDLNKKDYSKLIDLFISVISKFDNFLVFDLLSIMIRNDVRCDEMEMDNKKKFINVLNDKISIIHEIDDKEENEAKLNICNLSLKLLKYTYNDATIEIINNIKLTKIHHFLKYAVIDFKLFNDIDIKKEDINKLLEDIEDMYHLIEALEVNDRMDLLPKDNNVTQEKIARYALINWLEYPTELGKKPDTIELLEVYQLGDFDAYVYAFTSKDCNDNKKTLGISGFYHRGDLTIKSYSGPFSNFEVIGKDYKKQLDNLLDTIEEWRMAGKM